MTLEAVKFQKNNALASAFHAELGLLWTNGSSIYLTPLKTNKEPTSQDIVLGQHSKPTVLGTFKSVCCVSWSNNSCCKNLHIAAVCDDNQNTCVHIWRVTNVSPNLNLKLQLIDELSDQISKYGCLLWNCKGNLLAVLMKLQVGIYSFIESEDNFKPLIAVDADPTISKFICGCWSEDSTVFVLSSPSYIQLYQRSSNEQSNKTLQLSVNVSIAGVVSMTSASNNMFLCASEMKIENLIHSVKLDTNFDSPSDDQGDSSIFQSLNVLPVTQSNEATSLLTLVSSKGEIISEINISGLLTPVLIAWLPCYNYIMVGSWNSRVLKLFELEAEELLKMDDFNLPPNERPRGFVEFNGGLLLAVVDVPDQQQQLFPQSADDTELQMKLKNLSLSELASQTQCNTQSPKQNSFSYHLGDTIEIAAKTSAKNDMKESQHASPRDNSFTSNRNASFNSVEFNLENFINSSQCSPQVSSINTSCNTDSDRIAVSDKSSSSFSSTYNSDCSTKEFRKGVTGESIIQTLTNELQKKLEKTEEEEKSVAIPSFSLDMKIHNDEMLQDNKQSGTELFSVKATQNASTKAKKVVKESCYKTLHEIEYVHVILEQQDLSLKEKWIMLFPGGRLKYNTIKDVFGLQAVEVLIGTTYCVIDADESGYIPVIFYNGDKIKVREAVLT